MLNVLICYLHSNFKKKNLSSYAVFYQMQYLYFVYIDVQNEKVYELFYLHFF